MPKLTHVCQNCIHIEVCAYCFNGLSTCEDFIPQKNYRVPSEEKWMERYCNEKQLEEYKKRKEGVDDG